LAQGKGGAVKLPGGAHLTYCSNIHPGESWEAVRANLERYLPAVRRLACPDRPMGVGLRLSAQALAGLEQAGELAALRRWLDQHSLYVFTLNGFPYGEFHGKPVKDAVYRPDWRDPARLDYSNRLAEALAALLPDGVDGSISTVPGAYRAHLAGEPDVALIAQRLVEHAVYLHRLHERTGKRIALALEPEPGCLLETAADAAGFFQRYLFGAEAVDQAMALAGVDQAAAQALLRRHLGLCLDACHEAVAFTEPAQSLAVLREAGVAIYKVQLSAGLAVATVGPEQRRALAAFAEDVYLHQTVARPFAHYPDLPAALADDTAADEWRIHYHVPIWAEALPPLATTRPWLEALLILNAGAPISAHWEVETYTWSVLPPEYRTLALEQAIAQELLWAKERLP
jgi:hypothetical protein